MWQKSLRIIHFEPWILTEHREHGCLCTIQFINCFSEWGVDINSSNAGKILI